MINVRIFSGESEIRALAPAWRALTAKLKSKRHFHYVEWHLALAATFDRHELPQLKCIAVFSDDALVAVFPARYIKLQFGPIELNAVRLASDQLETDTARDLIITPTLVETDFFQSFVRYLADHGPAWDVIALPGILEDSFAATVLKHIPQLPFLRTSGGFWGRVDFISCGDHDQPFERLSKGFKQNLRTSHNKLKARSVTFEAARSENDLARLLPEFLRVESSGWKGEFGTSALKNPATVTFLHQLIAHFAAMGGCEIRLMRVDGESIGGLFGIVTDNVWYILKTGYDESYHQMSPGHLLIENLLKERRAGEILDTVTPYNAPPWFYAWKPDKALLMFNALVFRPSSKGVELANRIATILRGAG